MAHERPAPALHARSLQVHHGRGHKAYGRALQTLGLHAPYPSRGARATHRPIRPFPIGACAQCVAGPVEDLAQAGHTGEHTAGERLWALGVGATARGA
jgi:hypothetical protein